MSSHSCPIARLAKTGLVGIAVWASCVFAAHAQQIETDYSKYLSPIVFLLPKAPEQSASSPTRRYVAKIDIASDGAVVLPVELDPPEPAMSSAVNDAARFWLFAPGITRDCKPGPRTGRVGLEYETDTGRAWVELPQLEGAPSRPSRFVLLVRGDDIAYPRYEAKRGISAGSVTVVMKLMADGSSSEPSVFFAIPRTKGFMETALEGASQVRVKFNEPLDQPFLCSLMTYKFKLE